MNIARIGELLQPFRGNAEFRPGLLEQVQSYLELLLRWNARVNLTAVRDPEQMVTRHFGESLFAARLLVNHPAGTAEDGASHNVGLTVADVGSGAGFPGIPIKLYAPQLKLTLTESQSKKAVFLREVLRALKVDDAEVFCGRAEQWNSTADIVTLRAVEQFERVLPAATRLVAAGGRLCLLIGSSQLETARGIVGESWSWAEPHAIPDSVGRVVLIGRNDDAGQVEAKSRSG